MYDTAKAVAAQEQYCDDHGLPFFAPRRFGICFHCGRNIYKPMHWSDGRITGITVENAGKFHITGCPHCNFSFCD